jgi:hypothetical protein
MAVQGVSVPTSQDNVGEVLFERYMAQWGYDDYERHPALLNPPKHPDYLIRTAFGEVVVEVKSFETWGLLSDLGPNEFRMQDLKQTLTPIRDAISEAAKQLKGIKGRPLIVVLVNPDNRMPLSEHYVISAMYGELELPVSADHQEPGLWRSGRNGRLYRVDERGVAHGNHPYLSAVAVVREGLNEEAQAGKPAVTLDVFETVSDQCVPLPPLLFAHKGDTRWSAVGSGMYGRCEDL